jgi:hypothetical protein
MEGDVLLAGNRKITVFAVEEQDLPPNTPILLGVPHILALSVSLDFALYHPSCEIKEAMDFSLSPVFSRSFTSRKVETTPWFRTPPFDIWTVLYGVLFASLLGLTCGLTSESLPLESSLTLVSLFALWSTVFVDYLSRVVSNTTDSLLSHAAPRCLTRVNTSDGRTLSRPPSPYLPLSMQERLRHLHMAQAKTFAGFLPHKLCRSPRPPFEAMWMESLPLSQEKR